MLLVLIICGLPVAKSVSYLYSGGLGDSFAVARSLLKTLPLLVCSLGIAIAWKGGQYNIGGEGQYVMGGVVGAAVAKALPFGGILGQSTILLGCVLGGCAWAGISAWAQVKRNVQIVVSTILLNFVAIQVLDWVVNGPLQESKKQLPQSQLLPESLMLHSFDKGNQLHVGLVIALVVVALCHLFLFNTKNGFFVRVVGDNPLVARAKQVPVAKTQMLTMCLSGGLCGLSGGLVYLGTAGQLSTSFAQQWGFFAIPVALLGGLNPWPILATSLIFGILIAGTDQIGRFTPGGNALIGLIQSAAVCAVLVIQWFEQRRASA